MSKLKIDELFPSSIELIKYPKDFLYCFAPIEPLSTNPILRELMGRNGAQLVYRSKITPDHLLKAKNWQFLEKIQAISQVKTPNEHPVHDGIQLMAKNKDPIKLAVKFINDNANRLGISFLDLNFCCPGYKVRPQQRGGELMKKPLEIIKVIDQVLKYTDLPVSIKIRRGYTISDSPKEICRQIRSEFGENIAWLAINRAPVKMAGVNLRDLSQDLSAFIDAQNGLENKIPLIANGEIQSLKDIELVIQSCTSKGIMIGRAALGNPSIFQTFTQNKILNTQIEKSNIEHDLDLLFSITRKYQNRKKLPWGTLGKLKLQLHYFIKNRFSSLGKDLPPGYGYTKWRQAHFSKDQFLQKLINAFPNIPKDRWNNWLAGIN